MTSDTPIVLWFTGLSGLGKTTISLLLEKKLRNTGKTVNILSVVSEASWI